jgi:hypothetical protein
MVILIWTGIKTQYFAVFAAFLCFVLFLDLCTTKCESLNFANYLCFVFFFFMLFVLCTVGYLLSQSAFLSGLSIFFIFIACIRFYLQAITLDMIETNELTITIQRPLNITMYDYGYYSYG